MPIESGPSPDEMGIKQEKKEGDTGFGDLLELAQEVQATEPALDEKVVELKVEEEKKKRDDEEYKRMVNEGSAFSVNSGRVHYEQLARPEEFSKKAVEAKEDKGTWYKNEYSTGNDVRTGHWLANFPAFNGPGDMEPIQNTEEYLLRIAERINTNIAFNTKFTEDYISRIRNNPETFMKNMPGYPDVSTVEGQQAEIARQEEYLRNRQEQAQLFIRKQAEGFGRAALEAGDIAVAVDNLDATGILENPEIISALKTRMVELKASRNLGDQSTLRKTSEKLLAIQARKTAEARK